MKTYRLPDDRPEQGDTIIKEEVGYEIIVSFVPESMSVNLYLEPHSDYPDIVPDERFHDCDAPVDTSEETSTVDELPSPYPRLFKDAARAVEEKYGVTRSRPGVCTGCMPMSGDGTGTLVFTAFLE